MNGRLGTTILMASAILVGCSGGGAPAPGDAALDTNDQKASYGIGMNLGSQLVAAAERLDRPALMRGIEDALQENEPVIPAEEMQAVLQSFGAEIEAAAAAEREREGTENAAEGEAYLAQNGAREGVMTTESGLQYEVLREGDGASPTRESRVVVHYRGTLVDGTEFDSSYGGDPANFAAGGLIAGFTEALLMMQVGSHFKVTIPAEIAYGPNGSGPIGPNSTLIFEIELLEIVDG